MTEINFKEKYKEEYGFYSLCHNEWFVDDDGEVYVRFDPPYGYILHVKSGKILSREGKISNRIRKVSKVNITLEF